MNKDLLRKHIREYRKNANEVTALTDLQERREHAEYFRSWTAARLKTMTEGDLSQYLSKLWAMRIWGYKQYVVDKILGRHGLNTVREELAALVYGERPVAERWDRFRGLIKGIGPAMMSEILCHVHPQTCMLWNRRAYVALRYLGVSDLPRYDYQLDGRRYTSLCATSESIAAEMRAMGDADADLLTVDYFIWEELQVPENLSQIRKVVSDDGPRPDPDKASAFIHDEVRDKIADIGRWLGLQTDTEVKVAEGAVVDAIWQATIGNMGRVIYAFEVQTKGSMDSLILNLLKSLNNPAVQGVVAVSDPAQLQKIRGEVAGVSGLKDKLKCWDYTQVLEVHEALEGVNDAINSLGLVSQGF